MSSVVSPTGDFYYTYNNEIVQNKLADSSEVAGIKLDFDLDPSAAVVNSVFSTLGITPDGSILLFAVGKVLTG